MNRIKIGSLDVSNALEIAVNRAVWWVVNRNTYWGVYDAVHVAIWKAVKEAEHGATVTATWYDPEHPALEDFLHKAEISVGEP